MTKPGTTLTTLTTETTLGDLIATLYAEYLELYGDEDLASVAAAATINELLLDAAAPAPARVDAA